MMTHKHLLSVLGGSLLVLAACDGSDGVIGNAQAQFGAAFASAFNAGAKTAPTEPANITYVGGTGPSLTAGPVDL